LKSCIFVDDDFSCYRKKSTIIDSEKDGLALIFLFCWLCKVRSQILWFKNPMAVDLNFYCPQNDDYEDVDSIKVKISACVDVLKIT
jgi:hypothetical protein